MSQVPASYQLFSFYGIAERDDGGVVAFALADDCQSCCRGQVLCLP